MRFFAALICGIMAMTTAMSFAEAGEPRHALPFVYYLQNLSRDTLIRINPAVAVIDPYDSGLTPEDIAFLKKQYRQTLIAYLSVGEVDPNRTESGDGYAFREEWRNADWHTAVPKDVRENKNWNTARVAYWNPEWRAILASRIDTLIALGYDGVMLDTVDTFTAYEGKFTGTDVKQEMADLVGYLRDAAKNKRPGFRLYINGGMELYDTAYGKTGEEFLTLIDGQLKEDTWYNEKGSAAAEWTKDDLAYLKRAITAGKPVFTIDYFTDEAVRDPSESRMSDFMHAARGLGTIPYAADRSLGAYLTYNGTFFSNAGHWDTAKKHGITP